MGITCSIARRDFQAYFNSPAAYVVLGVFLLVLGYLFFSTLFLGGYASMRGFFGVAPVLFVVFGPAITMRLISEERKSGTIEQLLTLPVSNFQVVFGKFFAALGIVMVGLIFTLPFAFSVSLLTPADAHFDYGPVVGGYLGLILLASVFLSLGLFASSLTKNQIVAFIIGLALCFFFYFVDKFAVLMPASVGAVFEYISVDYHFNNIARGVVDSRDLVFYLSVVLIFLVLTERSLRRDKR
ncbi:MAG: ABC transporter permease subunit [Myxococcales bacterium]|nr:ABC transporter permease subunit [Myxococcales bacterium]USN50658.1 MAG: ABC transporter permease subunit [Myxococcales bacterium]